MAKDTITDEIKAIAPKLIGIKKTNCYQVPVGYFENLSLQENLDNTNNYKIPADYFDKMQLEVLASLETNSAKKKRSIYKQMLPWSMGIAASILLVLSIRFASDVPDSKDYTAEVFGDEIQYLSEHIEDFEIDDLMDIDDIGTESLDHIATELIEAYIQNNLEEFELSELESLL